MSSGDPPPQVLGSAQLDGDDGSVEVSSEAKQWGVLSPSGDAHWAYDPTAGHLVVTRSKPALDEYPDLRPIGETRVTDDGRLQLPNSVLTDSDEYPWSGYLDGGDMCYFDAPGDMLSKQLSYVLDEGHHEAFLNE